jgi:hypothetical protein
MNENVKKIIEMITDEEGNVIIDKVIELVPEKLVKRFASRDNKSCECGEHHDEHECTCGGDHDGDHECNCGGHMDEASIRSYQEKMAGFFLTNLNIPIDFAVANFELLDFETAINSFDFPKEALITNADYIMDKVTEQDALPVLLDLMEYQNNIDEEVLAAFTQAFADMEKEYRESEYYDPEDLPLIDDDALLNAVYSLIIIRTPLKAIEPVVQYLDVNVLIALHPEMDIEFIKRNISFVNYDSFVEFFNTNSGLMIAKKELYKATLQLLLK